MVKAVAVAKKAAVARVRKPATGKAAAAVKPEAALPMVGCAAYQYFWNKRLQMRCLSVPAAGALITLS